MKMYQSKLFGTIPAPESFNDLLDIIVGYKGHHRNVSFWRGQADINWPIDSSAARKIKLKPCSWLPTDRHIVFYEEQPIKKARKNMFDIDEYNRRMSRF